MIFVTVGAQMPFDRLIRAVDAWAGSRDRRDLVAQIGPTRYRPANLRWSTFLRPEEFMARCEEARAIVAHAGTGSLITALQLGKPILVMPRRAELRETRSDHQVATARQFGRFAGVSVAWSEEDLPARLDELHMRDGRRAVGAFASGQLIGALRAFFEGADPREPTPAADADILEELEDGVRPGPRA